MLKQLIPLRVSSGGSASNRRQNSTMEYTRGPVSEYKILLLGTGESGKRTIALQVRNCFLDAGLVREAYLHTETLRMNILSVVAAACKACRKLDIPVKPEYLDIYNRYSQIQIPSPNGNLAEDRRVHQDFHILLADDAFLEAIRRADEYQMHGDPQYLLLNWERICARGYVPTVEDILHSRLRTTGIVVDEISFADCNFSWILTGGQRSERRKWVHTFEGVSVVIFVVSLAEYNTTLAEHEATNRMQESLQLFTELTRSEWFRNVPVVLMLNKYDLFIEKIQKFDLSVCFPEYSGGCDHNNALKFIINKFKAAAERKIEIQITIAVDTESTMVTMTEIMRSCMTAHNTADPVGRFEILPQAIINHVLSSNVQ